MRYVKYRLLRFTFSSVELFDLVLSWLAVSLAFALVLVGFSWQLLSAFGLTLLLVGIAFLFHEMGHKVVAQHYGYFAEYRAFHEMLLVALAMSLFGFVFAAPGAVMILGNVSKIHYGKIAAAGPLVNFVFALLFLVLSFFSSWQLFSYGFLMNSWIGLFNLIPVWEFDGRKIYAWNKGVYCAFVVLGLFLVFFSFGGMF